MPNITITKLPWYWRLADKLMVPIMFVLGGFRFDSLQETHKWHVHYIDPNSIDLRLTVLSEGTDQSRFKKVYKLSFFFHAPIIGGWKNFTVYKVSRKDTPFHICWVELDERTDKLFGAACNKLPVFDDRIRMLDGPVNHKTYFFAFNQLGEQIPLHAIGHGRLGDGSFLSVRLF